MKQMHENQQPQSKDWDELDFIMGFEDGSLSQQEVVDGFQHLIDNGHAFQMQGMYGRVAMNLMSVGLCHPPKARMH